MEQTKSIQK